MGIQFSKFYGKALLGCAALALATPALADSTWSNFGSGCSATASSGVAAGNTLNCGTQTGVSLSANAYSTSNGASSSTGTTFAAASLYNWGSGAGLGAVNVNENSSTTGPHAVDNVYGTDAVRLSFSQAVTLKSLTIGWTGSTSPYNDSDLSILAWTGTGTPGVVTGKTLGGAGNTLLSGWTLVGNYADVGNLSAKTTAVSSTLYSSYWLVSAYNTAFGAGTNLSAGNDAFKLMGVSAKVKPSGSVPEPSSIAIIGAGLLGLFAFARRKQA